MSLNSTPRTWVAAETVTAAEMNAEVRDAITGIQAAGVAFTPSWTAATTNPVLGNGTLTGRWTRVGKWVDFLIVMTAGSTTTFGTGQWQFTVPANFQAAGGAVNCGVWINDTSASANWSGSANIQGAGIIRPLFATGVITNLAPMTWATGDVCSIAGRYEEA